MSMRAAEKAHDVVRDVERMLADAGWPALTPVERRRMEEIIAEVIDEMIDRVINQEGDV